jgi:hypothetical protein
MPCSAPEDSLIGVELAQIDAGYVAPGQGVEVSFKYLSGRVFKGKVETVLQAIATRSRLPVSPFNRRASKRRRLSHASSSTMPVLPTACRPAARARQRFLRIV